MSNDAAIPYESEAPARSHQARSSFVAHAKLIGILTLVSRILGMARESVAANYFGAGAVWSAFTVAFTIPNLFRKLFGEGALSAAFIPLYAQAVKHDHPEQARTFATASVNLLVTILVALTILGEIILVGMLFLMDMRPDRLLAVKLTAIMLPYVLLVCGTAFLGAILQVHRRFAATAAAPILLNLCLIIAIVCAARVFDLNTEAGQTQGVMWLSVAVLIAGVLQVLALWPSLHAAGFRFRLILHFWTPTIQRMLKLTIPVAIGAGVLQLSVFLDKGLALLLAATPTDTHFTLFGYLIRYPLAEGAAARLNWAQYLYQFPLGVFAIALATAIFPALSSDAMDDDRQQFRSILRRGIEATLFIGLPASIGLIVVRFPAIRLLFEHGNFTREDTILVARSTALYSAAIWAFSLQQILNRAYYALHDTMTPLVLSIVTLLVNLLVEIPLLWTNLAEAGMAAGTCASFAVQSLVMVWLLSRRVGGLELSQVARPVLKIVVASALMWIACVLVQKVPGFPTADRKVGALIQLIVLMTTGGLVYFGVCALLGMNVLEHIRRKPSH